MCLNSLHIGLFASENEFTFLLLLDDLFLELCDGDVFFFSSGDRNIFSLGLSFNIQS